jgi:hypothetical protein
VVGDCLGLFYGGGEPVHFPVSGGDFAAHVIIPLCEFLLCYQT